MSKHELDTYVMENVGQVTNARSPFWHATTTLEAARRWHSRARWIGSQPSDATRVAIRIDFWEWCKSRAMQNEALIDLSNSAGQQFFFQLGHSECCVDGIEKNKTIKDKC